MKERESKNKGREIVEPSEGRMEAQYWNFEVSDTGLKINEYWL